MHIKYKKPRANFSKGRIAIMYLLLTLIIPFSSKAQCAMCRAALQGDGKKLQAEAVNDGIIYLMIIPYILVAAVGYYVYQSRKKRVK